MLVKAILVHGEIGYKFCWLLPFEDWNLGTPVDWAPINRTYTSWAWKSNGVVAREGANFRVILSFQSTCDLRHKFGDFSFILLTLLIVSSTCSYFNISFSLVLVNLSLFVVLFSFVSLCLLQLILINYIKKNAKIWTNGLKRQISNFSTKENEKFYEC